MTGVLFDSEEDYQANLTKINESEGYPNEVAETHAPSLPLTDGTKFFLPIYPHQDSLIPDSFPRVDSYSLEGFTSTPTIE
jgi:hypothetical protein